MVKRSVLVRYLSIVTHIFEWGCSTRLGSLAVFGKVALNNSLQESIQTTPFVLYTGAHPVVTGQLGLPVDSPAATDFAKNLTDVVEHARPAMSNAQHRQ
jgi:hypothetical protein